MRAGEELASRTEKGMTKAAMLAQLSGRLRSATVLPIYIIPVAAWGSDADAELDRIATMPWGAAPLIVRSSARLEDRVGASLAGRYRSVADVRGRDALAEAVDAVIASYAGEGDEVLVQPFLGTTTASGVATSIDLRTGAPYRVINWTELNDTGAVTGGRAVPLRTWYGLAAADPIGAVVPLVLPLLDEVAVHLRDAPFEIEFACVGEQVVLLQTRRLPRPTAAMSLPGHRHVVARTADAIAAASRRDDRRIAGTGDGSCVVFANMSDWNPAEIIGSHPRPLALSLYRFLVTDDAWSHRRHALGYRDVRGTPLLTDFAGQPYIDTRVSFTSLVPAALPDEDAAELVRLYLGRLAARPDLQDKIEFEIALSAHGFDVHQQLHDRFGDAMPAPRRDRLLSALGALTAAMLDPRRGALDHDLGEVSRLERMFRPLTTFAAPTHRDILDLLRMTSERGVRSFAGLARCAFVATDLLRSLSRLGLLAEADMAAFVASLHTVTNAFCRDVRQMRPDELVARYGHLRPGTYDITSPRYDEAPERYLVPTGGRSAPMPPIRPFAVAQRHRQAIDRQSEAAGFPVDAAGLLQFARRAITAREAAKFIFSRGLSDALALLARLGDELGFSPDDLSFLTVDDIQAMRGESDQDRPMLADAIAIGRARHEATMRIVLPPVIRSPREAFGFEMPPVEPNFITRGRADGPVAEVGRDPIVSGCVALVRNADPGFDWLFTRPIVGLVTAYGGVNSHMAVRALELNLPAVIGAGETRYEQWRTARELRIDAAARQVLAVV